MARMASTAPVASVPQTDSRWPLSYKDAFYQWWSSVPSAQAERHVLSFLPFFPESDGIRTLVQSLVHLSGINRIINEISIQRSDGSEKDQSLVILHGYGAGLGMFYRNFDALSSVKDWKLYALDLLGYGRSGRPPFKIKAKEKNAKIDEAEAFFVDALEEWREKRKLEQFTLVGHSLGGYLAVAYSLKYPSRLKKLILVSPVGVPRDPYAQAEPLPKSHTQEEAVAEELSQEMPPPNKRPYPSWLVWLWEQNFSPFSVVRASGPLGPRLVSGWTTRRFSKLPPEEFQALHEYTYSIFRDRGSGEFALSYILAPGAFARRPLISRIGDLGIDVTWIYGANDWMDKKAGEQAASILRKRGRKSEVHVVDAAGHHVYLDNPVDFDRILVHEMESAK